MTSGQSASGLSASSRAVMASRVELKGQGDFFATPPWATRALCAEVLGLAEGGTLTCWEPACGEGHMSEPLSDYFAQVQSSDLFDRGYSPLHGPEWDFLTLLPEDQSAPGTFDWIITNPPFEGLAQRFVERALQHRPRCGVAVFVQLRWLETIERGETLFLPNPPTQLAVFCERVPLVRGGWDPKAGTATAYCWLVWRTDGTAPQPPMWIAPGACQRHSRLKDLRLARPRNTGTGDAGPLFGEGA